MKRRTAIAALVLVLLMLFSQFAFADGGLKVVNTVPNDGETGKQAANIAVKIEFNEDMSATANDKLNASLIKITDPNGKAMEYTIAHHDKTPNEIWCILNGDLENDTEYTVTVGAGIKASSGHTLDSATSFKFRTRNTKTDSTISIFLTIGMMAIMMYTTSKATKKTEAEKSGKKPVKQSDKPMTSDPYRLAKERGISVDEAKALIAKEKEKAEKKNASTAKARAKFEAEQAAKEAEIQRRLQEIHDASVYKVKTKGSLKAHGKALPKSLAKKLAAKKKKKK